MVHSTLDIRHSTLVFVLLLAGCDLFAPRTPAPPVQDGGTYVQPDTPDQVVENIQAAVAELNAQNYRRSLATDLVFHPAASAEARDPSLWPSWSRDQEERYFSTLAAAAQQTSGNELRLNDRTLSVISPDHYVLDATYVLNVQHRQPDVPTEVQGRLLWELRQGGDGLWSLAEWTDQEIAGEPSWSDLKAAFVQ